MFLLPRVYQLFQTYCKVVQKMLTAKDLAVGLGLMYFNDLAPGQMFMTDYCMRIVNNLKKRLEEFFKEKNYIEVSTPAIGSADLWKCTGHDKKYSENMFSLNAGVSYLKPMNCPFHILLMQHMYANGYSLPIKLYEFNRCFRNEVGGAINPMFRLSAFTQDDSHIIVKKDKSDDCIVDFLINASDLYSSLGMPIRFRLSNVSVDSYIGSESKLEDARSILLKSLNRLNIDYVEAQDEGAFYGPKIDIIVEVDRKSWQLGTIQVDLCSLSSLKFKFNNQNEDDYIVIHHATLGTFERFISTVLDVHGKNIPFKISPYKVCIVPFSNSESVSSYINSLYSRIYSLTKDVDIMKSNHYNKSIKKAELLNYKYILCIGEKEVATDIINVRDDGLQYNTKITNLENKIREKI